MIISPAKESAYNLESPSRPPSTPRYEDRAPESRVHRIRSAGLRDPSERGWILWIHVELGSLRNEKNQESDRKRILTKARLLDGFVSSAQWRSGKLPARSYRGDK